MLYEVKVAGWIKVYDTYGEALLNINETNHEIKYGIKITMREIIPEMSNEQIKVILLKKSTGEFGVALIFLFSKKLDGWFIVYPYEKAIGVFLDIYHKYIEIDNHNKQFWKKNENNG